MHLSKPITTLFYTLILVLVSTFSHALVQPSKIALKTVVEAYQMDVESGTKDETGSGVLLTLSLNMEPDWYTYANIPGGMGKPTKLTATAADSTPLKVLYPTGKRKPDSFDPSVMVNAYQSGTRLFVLIPHGMTQAYPISMRLDLLLCHPTKCVPVRLDLTFGEKGLAIDDLPAASKQPWWPGFVELTRNPTEVSTSTPQLSAQLPKDAIIEWNFTPRYLQPGLEVAGLVSAMLMGLLAGLILNIMPCVLPVVSLKLSALLNTSGSDNQADREASFREHNVFFALGIMAFFLVLALILGATGQAWGALFQNRWLVLGLAGIITALALSLFGLFHLPVVDLKFATGSTNPRTQAFFTGTLTTLLATPCSGPFLGGVLGWALVQGPVVIATVFASIGLGMAIPYLLMALNPGLARFLPKSGPWIEYIEKSIAFFLIGTAFYLITIALGGESLRILAPLWVGMVGVWLWIQTRTTKNIAFRWNIRFGTVLLLAASILWTMPSTTMTNPWEEFNPTQLSQRMGKERIFVDFTADWCPTCKVLEATVLTNDNITYWKGKYGITFIKVDMTERDPESEALLQALGSRSIPTAALFGIGEESRSPLVLRDLFTKSQLENILESWKK
jgi:thiol:disulfide interchange protein DsbD